MNVWIQDGIILLAVLACGWYVVRQIMGTFGGKGGKVGSCCAKGCPQPPANPSERVVFLPIDSLRKRPTD